MTGTALVYPKPFSSWPATTELLSFRGFRASAAVGRVFDVVPGVESGCDFAALEDAAPVVAGAGSVGAALGVAGTVDA